MKKMLPTLMICMILATSPVLVPALAKRKDSEHGKSHMATVHLYEKDSEWKIVEDGAWGKLKYCHRGKEFKFTFNGHGLEEGFEYELIYYCDPWPGGGSISLGTGTAVVNDVGVVILTIKGSVDTGDLPIESDDNYPDGAKIWLVLDEDFNGSIMTGWNPTEYLFENNFITFDDTDD